MRRSNNNLNAYLSHKTKYVAVFYIQLLSKRVCVFYNLYGQMEPLNPSTGKKKMHLISHLNERFALARATDAKLIKQHGSLAT